MAWFAGRFLVPIWLLLAAGSLGLQAEPTVTLRSCSGPPYEQGCIYLRAEVRGGNPIAPVQWTVVVPSLEFGFLGHPCGVQVGWKRPDPLIEPYYRGLLTILGDREVCFRPPLRVWQPFAILASCGTAQALFIVHPGQGTGLEAGSTACPVSPITLVADPGAPGGAMASSSSSKRQRTDPDAPAQPAPGVPGLLDRLPKDMLAMVARLVPAELAITSQKFNTIARSSRDMLLIEARDLDDRGLLELLNRHPGVKKLKFNMEATHALTGDGLVRALEVLPGLRMLSIINQRGRVTEAHLSAIALTHPSLARLYVDVPLSDDFFLKFPHPWTHLKLRAGGRLTPGGLGGLSRLVSLDVRKNPAFTGEGLPPTLTHLAVRGCDSFTGVGAGPNLLDLEVWNCRNFKGQGLPRGLRRLTVHGGILPPLVDPPESLVDMALHYVEGPTGKELPTTLRTLKMEQCDTFEGYGPPSLRELEVEACGKFTEKNLPPQLERLSVICSPFEGRSLPASLTTLSSRCPEFVGTGIPAGVTWLKVSGARDLRGLRCPAGLETLEVVSDFGAMGVHGSFPDSSIPDPGLDLRLLPRGLKTLVAHATGLFLGSDLPPSLVNLTVGSNMVFTGAGLPPLQTLQVRFCPRFLPRDLPPTLRVLEVSHCEWVTREALSAVFETSPKLPSIGFVPPSGCRETMFR